MLEYAAISACQMEAVLQHKRLNYERNDLSLKFKVFATQRERILTVLYASSINATSSKE